MRHSSVALGLACAVLVACRPPGPTYIDCDDPLEACGDGCVDRSADPDNCGACDNRCASDEVCQSSQCFPLTPRDVCAIDNGGCNVNALCMDVAGNAQCACMPGTTGNGFACNACGTCDSTQFISMQCTPVTDTVCAACSPPCFEGDYESSPCVPIADRVCSPCSFCGQGFYTDTPCGPTTNTVCAPCGTNCLACDGPGPSCFQCDNDFVLSEGMCVAAVCGNAVKEGSEQCDDGDTAAGDGCSSGCMVESDSYCFGEVFSVCRAGTCMTEPATALPLGSGFSLDGAGTASAAGLLLTQRSMIRTTAAVQYPVLVEATVVYSGFDITYAGTRGDGLRDGTASDEPTDALRARLSVVTVELATGPGTTTIAGTTPSFSPAFGVPYRVRFFDDGLVATVEWFNPNNLLEGVALQQPSSYHGSDDRGFVGGGDQGAVTVSDIRVCSAPALPVTSGLAAHYTAIPSWTVARDMFDVVSSWQDQSGNARTLLVNGMGPVFGSGLVNQMLGIDFNGGAGLGTSTFALTTDVSVFAVIHHRPSAQWGAIAHHGNRDNDWSMEQNGTADGDALHWQTNNDNVDMNLTLAADMPYVMTGIFEGNMRYFSATTFDTSMITPVSIVDASHTIAGGDKSLFVGASDVGEASNAVIGELVYYNRALTMTERDAVIAYLRALWRSQ